MLAIMAIMPALPTLCVCEKVEPVRELPSIGRIRLGLRNSLGIIFSCALLCSIGIFVCFGIVGVLLKWPYYLK